MLGGGGCKMLIQFIIQGDDVPIETGGSNIESKLTHETWIVRKKKWNVLPWRVDTVNRCCGGQGIRKVWTGEARKEKGFFTVEWVLARQAKGRGYLRSEWCKQKYDWAWKCGQGMNRAFSKWWEISLQIASLSAIRSILDCQANLFSVFFCLPRATAFSSCFIYSPKVHRRAHTADSLGYICSLEKTQIRNWGQHRVCGQVPVHKMASSDATKSKQDPSSHQYHNLPSDQPQFADL